MAACCVFHVFWTCTRRAGEVGTSCSQHEHTANRETQQADQWQRGLVQHSSYRMGGLGTEAWAGFNSALQS
jgi:hypothetical protein